MSDIQFSSNGSNVGIVTKVDVIGAGATKSGQKLTLNSGVSTPVVLTPSAAIALLPANGQNKVFTLVPNATGNITSATAPAGQVITLIITTSGTTSYTITFSTGFKSTGTLATGTTTAKVFVIRFIGDGTTFNEISRTTAM